MLWAKETSRDLMFATKTVHEMVSMSEKMDPSNAKSEVSQEDVEAWDDAEKGNVVSRTIAVED